MRKYLELLEYILDHGTEKKDRTGTGTLSVFGYQMRFNLQNGFPLLTTKKVHFPSVAHELLWFLKGDTNIQYLKDNNVRIWNEWATKEGELGNMYGKQWTAWQSPNGETINQIKEVIQLIKDKPDSRRLLVSAWNPADLPNENLTPQENVENGKMALAACHSFFQFYTEELTLSGRLQYLRKTKPEEYSKYENSELKVNLSYQELSSEIETKNTKNIVNFLDRTDIPKRILSCQVYQRSADVFLGVPFNIASYALLTHMVAQQCDMGVGELIWTGGDVHLYKNTLEQTYTQIKRKPKQLPILNILTKPKDVFSYKFEDFEILNYNPQSHIKATVSV